MAVMRHLTVDGTTYDTVGEASVTQVQTSGTKIAMVSIDGTSTDIYAPSGGGSTVSVTQSLTSGTQVGSISVNGTATALYAPTPPTASTTAPSMDGTASYGSGTSYARSNHVHPTDTSRQATLVSGTNIKTVNNESLLGSGNISVGGATYSTVAVQIATSAWSGTTATVNVTGVTASNDVIVAPAPASTTAWASAGIYCSAQGAGTLTFTCSTAPSEAVTANVMVFEGGEAVLPTYALSYTDTMTDRFSLSSALNNPINSASSGDTVYFGAAKNGTKTATVTAKRTDTQASVTVTYVSTSEYYVYSFTMPDAPVNVTVTWASPK